MIVANETFSFSWPTAVDHRDLQRSLGCHGVLRPLLCVAGKGSQLRLVAGGRRLAWAGSVGLTAVPVAVLEDCGPGELWGRLLAEAQDHRPLNPVEVGLYLRRRTAHTGEILAALETEVLPALGLSSRAAAAEDVLWVSGLPSEHRHGFADGSRPLHAARLLRGASQEDSLAVLAVTHGLLGGINKFTDLVRILLECAWRDGVPVAEWLATQGLDGTAAGLEALREQVRRRRYPHLSRWEEAFPAAVAGAGLPSRVSIHPPGGFEGGRYQCRMTFSTLDELHQNLLTVLERLEGGRLAPLQEFLG
ncbi:MAG TPA: ParB/Srx family N-terminal domain-containing protein [Deferrisomatales bacterium]|nr:ParB/Srx family N-terminal domain-containing protein [Deferrisomatales bacterium]